MIRKLIRVIRQAGAPSEGSTDRSGFLSYHAETHAVGVGLGIGWLAIVSGDLQLLGVVIPAITSGFRAKNRELGKILRDVYQEPHYALGALVAGALLGVATMALV